MAVWIRLLTLTDEGAKLVRRSPAELMTQSSQIIAAAGGRLVSAYATLGPFDLVSLIEARDESHMDDIATKLQSHRLYDAINVAAVPAEEFVKMSQTSPVFLKAWLDGRDARIASQVKSGSNGEATSGAGATKIPAKAASPKTERPAGTNTRKARRSTTVNGLAVSMAGLPSTEVASLALGPGETQAAFCVRVPQPQAVQAGLLEMPRENRIAIQLELAVEKSKIPLSMTLIRIDEVAGGASYDVVIGTRDLPRALLARLERFVAR
jgi:uncharacterized protein with GYD domain